jgi:hypothetical protein
MIAQSGARWISFEGRGVIILTARVPESASPDDLFIAALDRRPVATSSGHGGTMAYLDSPSPTA